MPDDTPKKPSVSVPRTSEPEAIRPAQESAVPLCIRMTIDVVIEGGAMKEQTARQTTTSITNINDSVVGSLGIARDVNLFVGRVESSELAADLKRALSKARQELDALKVNERSKADVLDNLDKVVDELQQAKPDQSRLRHLLSAIKEVAPPVASVLSVAASLMKLLGS